MIKILQLDWRGLVLYQLARKYRSYGGAHVTRSVTGCMPTRSMGTINTGTHMIVPTLCAWRYIQVLLEEYDDDRSYAPRGNAAQDAPRPLWNVAQMYAQAPALSTSCARQCLQPSVCSRFAGCPGWLGRTCPCGFLCLWFGLCLGRGASWAALPRRALIVIHKSVSTLIVPIAPRGHASCDAPRHKWHRLRIQ